MKTDMPDNILELSDYELLKYVPNTLPCENSLEQKLMVMKKLYRAWNYDYNNDMKIVSLINSERVLITALAGAGKTSNMIALVIGYQIFHRYTDATKIKFLTFNKDNPQDILNKYNKMRVIAEDAVNVVIDHNIQCNTFHSMARQFLKLYSSYTKLAGCELCDDEIFKYTLAESSVNAYFDILDKKGYRTTLGNKQFEKRRSNYLRSARGIVEFYELYLESLKAPKDLQDYKIYQDLKIPIEDLEVILSIYRAKLRENKIYTFGECLTAMNSALKNNKELREKYQSNNKVVIVDEVQDLSALMLDTLKYICDENSMMVCIGDDDQSIYGFRGVETENTLRFKDIFRTEKIEPVVLSLLTNRRCPSNVVELGKELLELNEDRRYKKQMLACKGPGHIELNSFSDNMSQYNDIITKLQNLYKESKVNNTEFKAFVGYKNKKTGEVIIDIMKDLDIPFYVSNGIQPYKNEVYRTIYDVFDILRFPRDLVKLKLLYKCTRMTKDEVLSALGYNKYSREYSLINGEPVNLFTIDASNARARVAMEDIEKLRRISKNIDKVPMSEYIHELLALIKSSLQVKDRTNLDALFASAAKYFNSEKTYYYFLYDDTDKKEKIESMRKRKEGVKFTTLHGLKGLEDENVFIMSLEDFDRSNIEESEGNIVSQKARQRELDEDTRVLYVAITRTKKNLYMYNKDTTSNRYVKKIKETLERMDAESEIDINDIDNIMDFLFDSSKTLHISGLGEGNLNKNASITKKRPESNIQNIDNVINRVNLNTPSEPPKVANIDDMLKDSSPFEERQSNKKWSRRKLSERFRRR